ncbi:MAG: hypothetical protein KC550_01595 [Nanoarchaeota archaeon]|nr:hypothetical protein [Nanoarchaeota archaeon]
MSNENSITEMHSDIGKIKSSLSELQNENNKNSTNTKSGFAKFNANILVGAEKGILFFGILFTFFKFFGFEIIPKSFGTIVDILTYTTEYISFNLYLNFILPAITGIIFFLIWGNVFLIPLLSLISKNAINTLMKINWVALRIVLILFMISGIGSFVFDNEYGQINDDDDVKKSLWQTWQDSALQFKCSTYGDAIQDPKCIALKNKNQNVVSDANIVKVKPIHDDRERITLLNKEDYFVARYTFETPVEIKLEKLECYTEKDEKKPFYTKTDFGDDNIIKGNVNRNFECKDLGTVLEKQKESLEIFAYLYFTIETEYTQKIPSINCQNKDIVDYLEDENNYGYKCKDLSIETLKKNGIEIADYNKAPIGSNTLVLDTHAFSKDLPVIIGDEIENVFSLDISITENSQIGRFVSGKITDIKLPNVLEFDSGEESKFNKIINDTDSNVLTFLSFRLHENNNPEITANEAVIIQDLIITTQTQLKSKWKSNNAITLSADFTVETKKENTNTTAINENSTNINTETENSILDNGEEEEEEEENEIKEEIIAP